MSGWMAPHVHYVIVDSSFRSSMGTQIVPPVVRDDVNLGRRQKSFNSARLPMGFDLCNL